MCYDVKTKLETQLKRARHFGHDDLVQDLLKKLKPYWKEEEIFHASGFMHPTLMVYTNKSPEIPVPSSWGLVPFWTKDEAQQKKLWNQTINARGETILEKPSFRTSAKNKRCVIYLDGFFEHHHAHGKTYPYYIHHKNNEPLALAGLWDEWTDKTTGEILHTFTIVTTKANPLMAKIHNNPKLPEPRMPVILPEEKVEEWLNAEPEHIKNLMKSFPESQLETYTVRPLRGKNAVGNTPEAIEPFTYEELGK